jgi:hypothetical protein
MRGRTTWVRRNPRMRHCSRNAIAGAVCRNPDVPRSRHEKLARRPYKRLLQLGVLRLGFLQDWDVGVGVFPEGQEIFVRGKRTDAGGIGVRTL